MYEAEPLHVQVDKQLTAMTKAERERVAAGPAPYPWCYGWPAGSDPAQGRLRCKLLGYCRRKPNCGD